MSDSKYKVKIVDLLSKYLKK